MLHKAFTGDSQPFVRCWLSYQLADIGDPIGYYMAFSAMIIALSQDPELNGSPKALPTEYRRDLFVVSPGKADPYRHDLIIEVTKKGIPGRSGYPCELIRADLTETKYLCIVITN